MYRICKIIVAVLASLSFASNVSAAITIETVPVGDPGNAGIFYPDFGTAGAVSYDYRIGKYEVTAGQYTEFLNKVAITDTYGLYNTEMAVNPYGCNIKRIGTSGNFSYSVASDYANRPVNFVSFWDSCRFTNWLHNGQPAGVQDNSTTERGAYTLTASGITNNTIIRNTEAKWAVTSEDEWYKSAFYMGGSTTADYWMYATGSDTAPERDMNDASGNNANYYTGSGAYPIDSSNYFTTLVGEFQNSYSSYGTFDQSGNVMEWNDTIIGPWRGVRGGSFSFTGEFLLRDYRCANYPTNEGLNLGFRVFQMAGPIPEPATIVMLAFGGVVLLNRRRR